MTIQQCKYVLEILKRGSFNEASKTLFVAQSSLSASVKALEEELHIKIFERSNSGIYLTSDGADFIRYASHIVKQNDLVLNKYKNGNVYQKLRISTQHYDFVADVFSKMLNSLTDEAYRVFLKETRTYDVIREVENGFSDVGIIAIKNSDYDIMKRFLSNKRIEFTLILKALPHIFVKKEHPLALSRHLTYKELKKFPFVSYEQDEYGDSIFAEEIMEDSNIAKHIEISDRASLMNVLITTQSYTIGTGIMPSNLNEGKIISIPLESDTYYNIGYILHTDRKKSTMTQNFVEMLKKELTLQSSANCCK